MSALFRSFGSVCLALLLAAPIAQAQQARKLDDLLTPITDPTDDWRVRTTRRGGTVEYYGQISPSFFSYDDGSDRYSYPLVGNSNATSRFGALWHSPWVGPGKITFRAEFGLPTRSSNSISQVDSNDDWLSDSIGLRKLELIIDTDRLGTFTLGQGSMATDGIAEIDLSGTKVAAFSSVDKPAGGFFLRTPGGALSSVSISGVFDNFDGDSVKGQNADGSRKLRVRYDTPALAGFRASFAAGVDAGDSDSNDLADVAIRYDKAFSDWRIAGGIGHARKDRESVTSGSISALHRPSGMSVTLAAGSSDLGGAYTYAKVGMLRQHFAIGKTAYSADVYNGSDVSAPGSRSKSVGLSIVQQVERQNIEVFGLLRHYSYSAPAASYQDSRVVMAGLRWKF